MTRNNNATYTRSADHNAKNRELYNQCHTNPNYEKYQDMIKKQNEPIKNDSKPIFELVIDDMRERAEHGKRIYGTYLQANNGRSALQDLYEELCDAAVYIKQKMIEEETAIKNIEKAYG